MSPKAPKPSPTPSTAKTTRSTSPKKTPRGSTMCSAPTSRKAGACSARPHQRHGEATGAEAAEAAGMTSRRSVNGLNLRAWTSAPGVASGDTSSTRTTRRTSKPTAEHPAGVRRHAPAPVVMSREHPHERAHHRRQRDRRPHTAQVRQRPWSHPLRPRRQPPALQPGHQHLRGLPPVFHRVVAFGPVAENAAETLRKGLEVVVVGQTADDSY